MKRTQEIFEQIEAYLDGELAGDALYVFEEALKKDVTLQKEIQKHREIKLALEDKDALQFRKKLLKINEEIKNEQNSTPKKRTFSFSYWKAAATILVLIGMTTFLWFNNNPEEDLFAAYYAPYPIGDIKRGVDTSGDDDFKTMVLDYKSKEYIKVIPALERFIQQKPNDEQLRLCLGNSYLNTDQLAKSEAIFQDFSSESKYYSDAKWFLSLTYLKMKEKDQTILLLKELISYDNIYKQNATKLLQDIKK